jgi:2-iminobutanoate/2-iminopropanoate deaminase
MRQTFVSKHLLKPEKPYSHAVLTSGRQLWVSGQLPVDPTSGTIVGGQFEDQAVQAFENLKTIVEDAGGNLEHAIKVQVYLKYNSDFEAMNQIYRRYFQEPFPARTTIQSDLRISLIEVDAVIALD